MAGEYSNWIAAVSSTAFERQPAADFLVRREVTEFESRSLAAVAQSVVLERLVIDQPEVEQVVVEGRVVEACDLDEEGIRPAVFALVPGRPPRGL